MSIHLKQTLIQCPKDGEYLFDVHRTEIEITPDSITSGQKQLDPSCPRCNPQRHFELLRAAVTIQMLKPEEIRPQRRY
jgi:hypothetical protein